jgi:hypothetical protein
MRIMKLAPAAAMALSGAALFILALAPLGTALGWWHFGFGLYWMMPWSGYVAATGVVLAAATLALGWSKVRPGGRLVLAAALVMGTVLAYVPWQYQRIRSTLPPIHDITTDTDSPPAFVAVLPARAAESAGSDDIVIRIAGTEAGSRIDMRSTSRQGRSDYGVNERQAPNQSGRRCQCRC